MRRLLSRAESLATRAGAGLWQPVRRTVRITTGLALAYGFGVALLLALLAPSIPDLFRVIGPGRELVMVFCRYASFLWALNSVFFVSVAVSNNLGHAAYATAVGWLRATVGTLPFVWLGARLGGAEGVLLGQTLGFALSSLPLPACFAPFTARLGGGRHCGVIDGAR